MLQLPSIPITSIDMQNCYWNPGCAMVLYKPELSKEILELLNKQFGTVHLHDICCHHNPQLPPGSTIINNCSGCDKRFRSLYPGIQTISLWEILDTIEDLPLPDYTGLSASVHDSCDYRVKPDEQRAMRSILHKMHIELIESANTGANSVCCGDSAYGKISLETLHQRQTMRANQMPCQSVVVQCVTCIQSMSIGGKTPLYLPDLLCKKQTQPQALDMDAYHKILQCYIDTH